MTVKVRDGEMDWKLVRTDKDLKIIILYWCIFAPCHQKKNVLDKYIHIHNIFLTLLSVPVKSVCVIHIATVAVNMLTSACSAE